MIVVTAPSPVPLPVPAASGCLPPRAQRKGSVHNRSGVGGRDGAAALLAVVPWQGVEHPLSDQTDLTSGAIAVSNDIAYGGQPQPGQATLVSLRLLKCFPFFAMPALYQAELLYITKKNRIFRSTISILEMCTIK